MTQGSVFLIGSIETRKSSDLLSLMPIEYESDSSVGVDTKQLFRMLVVGRTSNGKSCGILVPLDIVLRKWFQEYLENSERLNRLVDRIHDCPVNEVWDDITDEFDDRISGEALNDIADETNDELKNQITQALCDAQSRIQDKIRQELRSQYLEVIREAMCECIGSNLENEKGISHDAYMCSMISLRNTNRRCINRRCIRIARNISTRKQPRDVFRGLLNLIRRWTSCISMKWEWMIRTGLSLGVHRRYKTCVADYFRIGMQWQDVWKSPALTLFAP